MGGLQPFNNYRFETCSIGYVQEIPESEERWQIFLTFCHSSGRSMPGYPMTYNNTLKLQKGNRIYLTFVLQWNQVF